MVTDLAPVEERGAVLAPEADKLRYPEAREEKHLRNDDDVNERGWALISVGKVKEENVQDGAPDKAIRNLPTHTSMSVKMLKAGAQQEKHVRSQ